VSYYDGGRGAFYARENCSAITLANQWLGDVEAGIGTPEMELRVLTDGCKQDYSVLLPGGGDDDTTGGVVPEPLTFLAVLGATGALGGYLRRRKVPKVPCETTGT